MLPRSVHLEMDKINKEFFWNKRINYKPLIGWDDICKPCDKGGLGIRKTENMNKALQMKLLWKILAELENIWVRIIQERYLKNRSILQYSCKGDSSWQWKELMKLKEEFEKDLIWQIGDGETVKFWKDNWVLEEPLSKFALDNTMIDLNITVAEYLDQNKQWKKEELRQNLRGEIMEKIEEISIPR